MRLYVHYGDNTIILKWDSDSGTFRDLRKEFVTQYQGKYGEELTVEQLALTAGESTRPLDLDAKVSKLLKDKGDVFVKLKESLRKPSVSRLSPSVAQASPKVPTVPQTSPKRPHEAPVPNDMPPLEPDVYDEYAEYLHRRRQGPPVGASFKRAAPVRAVPSTTATAASQYDDEIDNSETEAQIGKPMSAKAVQALRNDPPGKRIVNSPCSVCGEILEFPERQDAVHCGACGTDNLNLRIVDAQSDCSRCGAKIHRRRGDISMSCEKCKTELIVVKCSHCSTPFVAPDVLTLIPCVSCGKQFIKDDCLIVSPKQSLFLLINSSINEPESFKRRLQWKKPNQPINLVTQYYRDDSPDRQAEIDRCLINNVNNDYIDKIHLFCDASGLGLPAEIQDSPKITRIEHGTRLKFKDTFGYCSKVLGGQICVVANSDIYFDQSLRYLLQLPLGGKFLALSRVDETKGGHLQFNEWTAPISQDAWIFRSPVPMDIDLDYYFGWMGCDNRVAYEMKRKSWHVVNPSLKIVCRHVHITDKRNYTQEDRVPGAYAAVPPAADF